MTASSSSAESLTSALRAIHRPGETGLDSAWVGLEPTFQTRKSVENWQAMSDQPGGEEDYFEDG
ncbi:MAG: hypothetical protein WED34_02880 [Planctomycetales bacterium]